jgi:Golgi nucleoside diphosphatase
MFQKLKFAYQRVVRGYDDTIKWGFSTYFRQFIKPLKEFCEDELTHISLENDESIEVFKETLRLIKQYEERQDTYNPETEEALWRYVGDKLMFYWN